MEIKNILRLDHAYLKLHGQSQGRLVALQRIRLTREDEELKIYDGEHFTGVHLEDEIAVDKEKNGDFIQMVFIGEKGIPFSVFREYRKWKWDSFRDRIGMEFEFEIKKERK